MVWFGHIGDGNLHLNILKPENLGKDEFFARCATVNKWVFETVEKYNGSISAEHGVGMTKRDYLTYTRSETEIAYMKALKAVFDPNGIMNPARSSPSSRFRNAEGRSSGPSRLWRAPRMPFHPFRSR